MVEEQDSPLTFPFLQAMITDFKDINEGELAIKYNELLVKAVTNCFGEDNIFYLGYSFDYYAQMMSENFNLGFQKISKLLPKIKEKCPVKNSIIITLIEAYIDFSKITVGINPQAAFHHLLDLEKNLLNILPKDHIFFEIIYYAKVVYFSRDLATFDSAIQCYDSLLKISAKSNGVRSKQYHETL